MLQESGRLALSDAWDQDQFEMPQWEKLLTRLFFLELMAKMPYTMECFFQSHLVLSAGPPAFHAAESPFELSERKPQWHIYSQVSCLHSKLHQKHLNKSWHFVSKFEIWFSTPGDAKDLRVGGASRLSAIDDVECFIHALDLGKREFLADWVNIWWFWLNVWVKLLSLGCEYTKILYKITRHFNCRYRLSVKILCMFLLV